MSEEQKSPKHAREERLETADLNELYSATDNFILKVLCKKVMAMELCLSGVVDALKSVGLIEVVDELPDEVEENEESDND